MHGHPQPVRSLLLGHGLDTGGYSDHVLAIAHRRERAEKQANVDGAGFIEFMPPNVAQRQLGKADGGGTAVATSISAIMRARLVVGGHETRGYGIAEVTQGNQADMPIEEHVLAGLPNDRRYRESLDRMPILEVGKANPSIDCVRSRCNSLFTLILFEAKHHD